VRADGQINKQALVAEMRGKKAKEKFASLGRPRTRWRDSAMKDLKLIQERALIDIVYNREEWNKFVMAALDLNGLLNCIG